MSEVEGPVDSYPRLLHELAELTGQAQAQRTEAVQWYDRQCAAAQRAVREASEAVDRAETRLAAAWEQAERIDAEAAHLWQSLGRRLRGGRALGEPPAPVPGSPADPATLLRGARELLERNRHPGELPAAAKPLLVLLAVLVAATAYGLGLLARWAGARQGGDLAVGLPVLGLLVTLLGPVGGLLPAKLVADRQHADLDARAVAAVLISGALTTALLFALLR